MEVADFKQIFTNSLNSSSGLNIVVHVDQLVSLITGKVRVHIQSLNQKINIDCKEVFAVISSFPESCVTVGIDSNGTNFVETFYLDTLIRFEYNSWNLQSDFLIHCLEHFPSVIDFRMELVFPASIFMTDFNMVSKFISTIKALFVRNRVKLSKLQIVLNSLDFVSAELLVEIISNNFVQQGVYFSFSQRAVVRSGSKSDPLKVLIPLHCCKSLSEINLQFDMDSSTHKNCVNLLPVNDMDNLTSLSLSGSHYADCSCLLNLLFKKHSFRNLTIKNNYSSIYSKIFSLLQTRSAPFIFTILAYSFHLEDLMIMRKNMNINHPFIAVKINHPCLQKSQPSKEENNIKQYDAAYAILAYVLSFLNANKGHSFYTSGFVLTPTILQMADFLIPEKTHFKCNVILNTLFLKQTQKQKRKRSDGD